MDAKQACEAVATEVSRAQQLFPGMVNPHEALAIIQEEFHEFRAEVYRFNLRKNQDSRPEMKTELVQLAAMCVRAIADLNL